MMVRLPLNLMINSTFQYTTATPIRNKADKGTTICTHTKLYIIRGLTPELRLEPTEFSIRPSYTVYYKCKYQSFTYTEISLKKLYTKISPNNSVHKKCKAYTLSLQSGYLTTLLHSHNTKEMHNIG